MEAQRKSLDAIVIGAGPGGLGTAALLKRHGLEVVVIERGDDLATTCRSGYDRLLINTSSWFSYLPGSRFPRHAGRWLSRDALVACYYRDYAAANELVRISLIPSELRRPVG